MTNDAGLIRLPGLADAMAGEVLAFPGGRRGLVWALERDAVVVALLDPGPSPAAGEVTPTGRLAEIATGPELLGRVVDPLGRPLDGGPAPKGQMRPLQAPAPRFHERAPKNARLWTGVKRIDHLVPLYRGDRRAIIGPPGIGKTTIALDAIIGQRGTGVTCVYVAIGKTTAAVSRIVETLRLHGALGHTTVVLATRDSPPAMLALALLAGTAIGESVRDRGGHALVIYDDLTRFEPAFVATLLECADVLTDALGGGSLTALPLVEYAPMEPGARLWPMARHIFAMSAPRLVLAPLELPGVDGRTVDVQLCGVSWFPSGAPFRGWAAKVLTPALSQGAEVLAHLRQRGLRRDNLDRSSLVSLERAERLHAVYAQPQATPVPVEEQTIAILAVAWGHADNVPPAGISWWERGLRGFFPTQHQSLLDRVKAKGGIDRHDSELVGALEAFRARYSRLYQPRTPSVRDGSCGRAGGRQ